MEENQTNKHTVSSTVGYSHGVLSIGTIPPKNHADSGTRKVKKFPL
jgi:hypothetical protein